MLWLIIFLCFYASQCSLIAVSFQWDFVDQVIFSVWFFIDYWLLIISVWLSGEAIVGRGVCGPGTKRSTQLHRSSWRPARCHKRETHQIRQGNSAERDAAPRRCLRFLWNQKSLLLRVRNAVFRTASGIFNWSETVYALAVVCLVAIVDLLCWHGFLHTLCVWNGVLYHEIV